MHVHVIHYSLISQRAILVVTVAVAYPGLVKGGCSVRTRNFAHAQIVGRCGFEREYGRNTVRVKKPKTFGIVL